MIDPVSPPETGLYLWDYDDPDSKPQKIKLEKFEHKAKTFHPLGIDYLPTGRKLFVVNVTPDGVGIEIFKLQASDRKASHIRTLSHSLISTPNSIAAYNNSHFFATNDHYYQKGVNPYLSTLETYLALPGGNVVHGDRPRRYKPDGDDIAVKVLDNLAFANGVTFLNSTTLAVASCGRQTVNLYNIVTDLESDHPTLELIHRIEMPFLVDNVKSDKRGTLLMAGHPHPPTTEHFAANAAQCNAPGGADGEGCDEKGLSWISQWSEKRGLEHLYAGDDYPTSCSAQKYVDRGLGMAVGLYAKGVLTWEE